MPDQQRCCLLGLCCPPGSPAQRASLEAWLREKYPCFGATDTDYEEKLKANLDELFGTEV